MIYATTGKTWFAPYTYNLGKFKHENMLCLDDRGAAYALNVAILYRC